jgi:uncharacterized protein YbbC (DUF1343 family)
MFSCLGCFTPKSTFGAKHPKHENILCNGYDLTDFGSHFMPDVGELYLHWLTSMYHQSSNQKEFFRADGFFNLLMGNKEVKQQIIDGKSVKEITATWKEDVKAFKLVRKNYLLYDDFE